MAEIRAWFAQQEHEFIVHEVPHGGYFAVYWPTTSRSGNAPFTWAETAVDAAERAQGEFQASQDQAAAAETFRRGIDESGGFFGQRAPEERRRDLGIDDDITRRG